MMGVTDHNFRSIDHAVTMFKPAVAELSIFAGSRGKIVVKAIHYSEKVRRQSQVVGGKKSRPARIGVIAVVKIIVEHLTGG